MLDVTQESKPKLKREHRVDAVVIAETTRTGQLPQVGRSRLNQFIHLLPMSRETWRKLVLQGRAPQPDKSLGSRFCLYSNEEVNLFIQNPAEFNSTK